jgi:hypothetical protein
MTQWQLTVRGTTPRMGTLNVQLTLMKEARSVPETLVFDSTLTRQIAREDSITGVTTLEK